jgi:eukaryotic-like serine/threonine-protein kinase
MTSSRLSGRVSIANLAGAGGVRVWMARIDLGGDMTELHRKPAQCSIRAVGSRQQGTIRAGRRFVVLVQSTALALLAASVVSCDRGRAARSEDMVAIAAGEFFAGCDQSVESKCLADEKPGGPRQIKAFAIDRTEVTVEAYRDCVEAGDCSPSGSEAGCNASQVARDRHPINCVDWDQAVAYCAWREARLPSEWEWERAARGPDGLLNPWGNEPVDCTRAVIDEGSGNACGKGDTTFEVGSRPAGASAEGALDLIGNVWEWTASSRPGRSGRIVRGGGYYITSEHARASFLLLFKPDGQGPFVGFRCAR